LANYGFRRSIANRFVGTIRLHRPSWELLSEEHKVALLIHEALYSLLTPVCLDTKHCFQPAYRARDIVAMAFTDPKFSITKFSTLSSNLEIPSDMVCPIPTEMAFASVAGANYEVPLNAPGVDQEAALKGFCDTFRDYPQGRSGAFLQFYRPSFRLLHQTYPAWAGNNFYSQQYLKVQEQPSTLFIYFDTFNENFAVNDCRDRLTKIFIEWESFQLLTRDHPQDCISSLPSSRFEALKEGAGSAKKLGNLGR
jgi:hypothetical protein